MTPWPSKKDRVRGQWLGWGGPKDNYDHGLAVLPAIWKTNWILGFDEDVVFAAMLNSISGMTVLHLIEDELEVAMKAGPVDRPAPSGTRPEIA